MNKMMMFLFVTIGCLAVVGVIATIGIRGGFNQTEITILTQDGRYIGMEIKKNFRLPNQPDTIIQDEVGIVWFGNIALIPSGDWQLFHTIEKPKGFFQCNGLLPDNVTIQDALNSLPKDGGKIVFPQQ